MSTVPTVCRFLVTFPAFARPSFQSPLCSQLQQVIICTNLTNKQVLLFSIVTRHSAAELLLSITVNYYQLLSIITIDYRQLLSIIINYYYRLPSIIINYYQLLLSITVNYYQLLPITVNYNPHPLPYGVFRLSSLLRVNVRLAPRYIYLLLNCSSCNPTSSDLNRVYI
jgi:hypothetical protein